jgi:parvulin-like peptidyl-prolyl isomerase
MRRQLLIVASLAVACLAGVAAGQWILHCTPCRDAIGRLCGRGHLLALTQGHGIYEYDLDRALVEKADAADQPQDRHQQSEDDRMLQSLIANTRARALESEEKVAPAEIDHELDLLRWQFRDLNEWRSALQRSRLSAPSLRKMLCDDLQAHRAIQVRIDSQVNATPDECRAFYDTHPESFSLPERFRASHLFLAAPPDTPPEIVDQKRERIGVLAQRLAAGEDFFELVARESEDEETKARGGDLGFFSAARMPPDFFVAVKQIPLGRIGPPIQTRLGFHIVQLTDAKPARLLNFDEAEPEISLRIANQKRETAGLNLAAALASRAEFERATQ